VKFKKNVIKQKVNSLSNTPISTSERYEVSFRRQ